MKTIPPLLVITRLTLILCLIVIIQSSAGVQAQTTGEIPKPQNNDSLSTENKILLQQITDIADKIEKTVSEKEEKLKLELKRVYVGDGAVPVGTASTYIRWKKGKTLISIKVFMDKAADEADKKFSTGFTKIARGLVIDISNINYECKMMTDFPGEPSTTVNLSCLKNRYLIDVGATNQSQNRTVNEQIAKDFAALVNSLLK